MKTVVYFRGKDGRATQKSTTISLRDPIKAIDVLNRMDKVYTEGPVGDTYNINVDKMAISIREKLENAVKRLRVREEQEKEAE